MSVPAEKLKAGAHRKGGPVLMRAKSQKRCVSGQERAVCFLRGSIRIQCSQCSAGLGEFTLSQFLGEESLDLFNGNRAVGVLAVSFPQKPFGVYVCELCLSSSKELG